MSLDTLLRNISPFEMLHQFACDISNLQLHGRIVAAQKNAWQGYKSTMILFTNINGLRIFGEGGLIDGYGSSWWPCKHCPRPSVRSS